MTSCATAALPSERTDGTDALAPIGCPHLEGLVVGRRRIRGLQDLAPAKVGLDPSFALSLGDVLKVQIEHDASCLTVVA
jgi:hypothetical protein